MSHAKGTGGMFLGAPCVHLVYCAPGCLGEVHIWSFRATFTLNVISSMTYTRSGNALATSSTLLKYCTGSFISRSCSSSLNCPKTHGKQKRCEMLRLDSCHRGNILFLCVSLSLSWIAAHQRVKKDNHLKVLFSKDPDKL